jgi:regulator of nucleoside diphosphate kinase
MTSVWDRERLLHALDHALGSWTTYAPYLDFFRRRLRRSGAVAAADVAPDVITMNSSFLLENDRTGNTAPYTLVYPEEEAPHKCRVSVLSPMGMVLYGAKVGDAVCWLSPVGPEVATVKELLYQPEAAGHRDR